MVQFRPGSHMSKLVALLSFAGEFPFLSLGLLGSERVYKALVVKLSAPEVFRNTQTGDELSCRLFTVTGSGKAKTVRLYKRALPILEWVHEDAYRYYMGSFWEHHFPGDSQHLDRNHRVAEAAAVCMRAGMELRPYLLPRLQNDAIQSVVLKTPSLYLSKDIKRISGPETAKTTFTRMIGATFYPGGCYGVYNTRDTAMKWNGMGEVKTVYYLTELARLNAGVQTVDSAILFGASEGIALQSFSEKSAGQHKTMRSDAAYQHIHFVPLNEMGVRQMRILTVPNWKERILDALFLPETRSYGIGRFEYDACVDGGYIFSHLDSDLNRLIRFKEAIEHIPGPFEVLCFPHQVEFLREYLEGRAVIKTIELEAIEEALEIKESDTFE
ncbi:hypothetical protein [Acutalibacter intestini]|uniref:hypothetical protein n=1 Tax=Acutalibacter intestini TaxID=3093659 RepID=UPI002AC9E8A6|nr:hypothetical protein [Acutalibacter sp. M00204]